MYSRDKGGTRYLIVSRLSDWDQSAVYAEEGGIPVK
jgi:hypothetical protein